MIVTLYSFIFSSNNGSAKDSISFALLGAFGIWTSGVDVDGFDSPTSNDCGEHSEIMLVEVRRIERPSVLMAFFIFGLPFV
jgi:hypothetical protein